MNKFIISMNFEYDQYDVLEHYPCETKHSKEEIIAEFQRIFEHFQDEDNEELEEEVEDYFSCYCGSKCLPILDTGFILQSEYQLFAETGHGRVFEPPTILTLEEWFETYKYYDKTKS